MNNNLQNYTKYEKLYMSGNYLKKVSSRFTFKNTTFLDEN